MSDIKYEDPSRLAAGPDPWTGATAEAAAAHSAQSESPKCPDPSSDSLMSAYNLALGLEAQARYVEALSFARRSEDGWRRQLGSAHPKTRGAERVRRRIESQIPGLLSS